MSGLLTRWLTLIRTNCATMFSKVDWQPRDTALACLTVYVFVKQHHSTREVTELDRDVDVLSDDAIRVKHKLEDVSATTQKQKRDLLVLKADTNEMLCALEFKLQAIESHMKSSLARDVAKECLTHEAELRYA